MDTLTRKTKLGYGVGDLGGNLFFTLTGFYLLFYLTDVVGMSAGLAGTALMIGKVWDAVSDPLVGYLSDHYRSKMGRRRPFMMVGAIGLVFAMVLMFFAPGGFSGWALFAYVVLANCLLNTAYTLINIPYGALTPDLTSDFHERTVLNGYRMSFAVVGTFLGAGLVLPLVGAFGGGKAGWTAMALVTGLIVAISTIIVVAAVRERSTHDHAATATTQGGLRDLVVDYTAVLKIKPFLLALFPWSFHITGINVIQAAMLYYFREIYGNEAAFQIALPLLLLGAIIGIPAWVRISRFIGKRNSYNAGMSIFAAAILTFFFIGHLGGVERAFLVMFVAGLGFATQYVMPYSIIPDVVEYDYAYNGRRREGVFYGLWTFMSKLGQAFGIALNGWVLDVFGYQQRVAADVGAATGAGSQPESAIFAIRLLVGPIPVFFFVCGIVVLAFYPIGNRMYQQIMERAHQRSSQNE